MSVKLEPFHITVFSGDTLRLQIDVVDDNGIPVALTGGTGIFSLARDPDSTKLIDSDSDATTVVIGPGIGSPTIDDRVTVTIPNALVAPLRGTYYAECQVIDASSNIGTVAFGYVNFRHDLN